MDFGDWASTPQNWVFLVIALPMLFAGFKVVQSPNIVHAVLYLVATLAGSAALFILVGAEFVAWTLVLVYIGAVIVLFLFGIMITRAPIGYDAAVDNERKGIALFGSLSVFALMAWSTVQAFGDTELQQIGEPTGTELIAESLLGRFVLPFEIVSFVLLAALIGGIAVARKDQSPAEEERS